VGYEGYVGYEGTEGKEGYAGENTELAGRVSCLFETVAEASVFSTLPADSLESTAAAATVVVEVSPPPA